MSHDDELGLAPSDDEELGLAPIEDENAGKVIAPDLPFDTKIRLIPVICSACRTRLYAGEDQIGMWKKCPDCERLTEIRPVAEKFMLVADDPEAAGGYEIGAPELSRREIFRIRSANKKLAEAAAEEIGKNLKDLPRGPVVFENRDPLMERALNRLLKSDTEKDEERSVSEEAERIRREVEAINRAVRDGKLEEHLALAKGESTDATARKLAEKQRRFEAAVSAPPPLPPPPPVPSRTAELAVFPPSPPLPAPGGTTTVKSSYLAPLLDSRCRSRMIVLTVCGLIGNFFGEKARSMVWQVVFDKVYEQYPGYVYTTWESVLFVGSFWIGAFFTALWLTMLFLFGISLFLESAAGKDRVENWSSFDLNFGCSYFGWTLLIFFISGFPGFLLWQGASLFFPHLEGTLMQIHYLGWFVCFPILFLCVIESDTFFGSMPRKTLGSLRKRPDLWTRFYAAAFVFNGIPVTVMVALMYAGTACYDHPLMNSPFYYFGSSILLTCCGFFVLFYFRLLGRTAWAIKQT